MRLLMFATLFFFVISARATDPFSNIEHIKLENGIDVYLAPKLNAKLFKTKVIVDVGWIAESSDNWGVSHLLEHVLFRDKALPEEMSYLQLIKEKGGEANGVTNRRSTSYFATIPYRKQDWLFDNLFNMLMKQEEILDHYVEKEKETVLREIGEPSKLSAALNFDVWKLIKFDHLKLPDMWQTQFGVSYDDPFTREQERLTTLQLSQEQVLKHYQNYYHPENINLFFAGNFNKKHVLEKINRTWGQLARKQGLKIPLMKEPTPNLNPYYRVGITAHDPFISIGTKSWDISLRDEVVIDAYLEHLAHRLMKEVRNKFGYTYDVSAYTTFYNRFGYGAIEFNTKENHYLENKALLESYIVKEAEAGALSDEYIKEAKILALNSYEVTTNDVHSLMAYAELFHDSIQTYGTKDSPYKLLQNITPFEFNEILKRNFKKTQRYVLLHEPTYFFTWDYLVFALFAFAISYRRFRLFLTKKFDHTGVKWSRKVQYPPFYVLQGVLTILAFVAFAHLQFGLSWLLNKIEFFNRSLFLGYYIHLAVYGGLVAVVLQSVYACIPRKLILVDGFLYVKSLTYYSRKISVSEIESIRTHSLVDLFKSPKLLVLVSWRVFYFDLFIWRKALFISLKSGSAYIFSFRNATKASEELNKLLGNSNSGKSKIAGAKDKKKSHDLTAS